MKVVFDTVRLLLGLFVIAVIFVVAFWCSTKPIYSGSIDLPNLNQEVVVNFDNYGIPHIEAENKEDLYYSFGYIHAQERLFQMEMIKRLVNGRLAEIIGPDLIETDKYMRTLGLGEVGKKSAEKYLGSVDQEYQKLTFAYINGVNEFIENGKTPIEYRLLGIKKELFTPADIYNVTSFMALGFSAGLKGDPFFSDIQNKFGDEYLIDWGISLPENTDSTNVNIDSVPESEILAACFDFNEKMDELGIPIWEGSNAWILSGERTESGKPILANDTHIAFSQPSVYYEAHLKCPDFEFYGNFLAGLPFAVIGHNQNLGWGLTIFPVDNLDIYREKVNPKNKNEVWINNKWTPIESKTEVIKIKGGEEYSFEVYSTLHGPIVNDILGRSDEAPLAMHWVILEEESKILEGVCGLNHAKNKADFIKYRSFVDIIGLNVMYADVEGTIAWYPVGKIPLRNPKINPRLVLDGSDPYYEWQGYMAQKDYPFEVNPPRGYIVSSNNNPYEGTQKIPGDYQPIFRAARTEELLLKKEKWDTEGMKAIHLDNYGEQHLNACTSLLNYLGDNSAEEVRLLVDWKGDFNLEEIAPTIYSKFLFNTIKAMMKDELDDGEFMELCKTLHFDLYNPYLVQNEKSVWWDDVNTTDVIESPSMITKKAWEITLKELNVTLGEKQENWKWENVHLLTHIHPIGRKKPFGKLFNVGPFPVAGGNQTVNKMAFANYSDSIYHVRSGPALRTVIDFSNVDATQSVNPTGQSGVASSKYYQDQAQMFVDGKYRGQLMNWEEIKTVSSRLVFRPQ